MAIFDEVVNIQAGNVSTGAAGGLMSLSDKLRSFSRQSLDTAVPILTEQAQKRGREEAQAVELQKKGGITQAPEYKEEHFIGGVKIKEHNRALRDSYMAALSNDINNEISNIELENSNDFNGFSEKVEALRQGMLPSVDPAIRQSVAVYFDNKASQAGRGVRAADVQKQNDNAKGDIFASIKRASDQAETLARNGDMKASGESLLESFSFVDSAVESGFLNDAEAAAKKREIEISATTEALTFGIKEQMRNGDYSGALESIGKFREKVPKGYTAEEHDAMIKSLTSEISETITLNNKMEDQEKTAIKERQDQNEIDMFVGILTGRKNAQDITKGVASQSVSIEKGVQFVNILQSRGAGVDDYSLISGIRQAIRDGQDVSTEIMNHAGSRLTESTALDLLEEQRNYFDRESPLQTSRSKRAESFIRRQISVPGPFGALDPDKEKRLADNLRTFSERVLQGEDPFDVADDLVGKDEFNQAPSPRYGNKDDLQGAQEALDRALLGGEIDDATYNYEYNNIQVLKQLKQNIENFNSVRKESMRDGR